MRRKNLAQVMRTIRQQALDRTTPGVGIVYPVALNDRPPSLVERGRIVSRIDAGRLHGFDKQRSRILCTAEQNTAMAADVSIQIFLEIEQVWQDQPKRLLTEEG